MISTRSVLKPSSTFSPARTKFAGDKVRRSLQRLIDGVADGSLRAALVGRKMEELEAEAAKLESDLQALPAADAMTLQPATIQRYLRLLNKLADTLASGVDREAGQLIRALIERVVAHSKNGDQPPTFDINGRLAALLDISGGR